MQLKHVILMCLTALAIGSLIGIYVHSQIVSGTIEKMQNDAKQSTVTVYK